VNASEPRWWPTDGDEPDPRWSFANERTLLAYERTALGLVVAGLAIAGSHTITDTPAWFAAVGVPFIALGAVVALEGRKRYLAASEAAEIAVAAGARTVLVTHVAPRGDVEARRVEFETAFRARGGQGTVLLAAQHQTPG